jgi:hypothetical protein
MGMWVAAVLGVAACEIHSVRWVSCLLQRASGDARRPAAICGTGGIEYIVPDNGFGRCDGHHEMVDFGRFLRM